MAFSEFGFPKAHAAAFGLLAYQSAWLRRHYPAEFLCALLNEQPMGFYPPASLVRDAQRRGVEVRGADVNASLAGLQHRGRTARCGSASATCAASASRPRSASWRRARRGGPYTDVADLVRRAGLSLARVRARHRRRRLRRLRAAARAALARRADRPARVDARRPAARARPRARRHARAAAARRLGRARGRLRDDRPLACATIRSRSCAPASTARGFVTTAALEHIESGTPIGIAGLTVARQRPASAKGVVFLLLEDEHGLVNLVLFRDVYEQHRLLARTEPLLEAHGRWSAASATST